MRRLEAEPRVSGVTFAMVNPGDEPVRVIEAEASRSMARAARPSDWKQPPILCGLTAWMSTSSASSMSRSWRGVGLNREMFRWAAGAEGGAVLVNLPLAQRIFGGNALGRRIR